MGNGNTGLVEEILLSMTVFRGVVIVRLRFAHTLFSSPKEAEGLKDFLQD